MNNPRRVLSYNDVSLCPRYSPHRTTAVANVDYDYGIFRAPPLINAPMDTVCSPALLNYLHKEHQMAVTIHRFFRGGAGEQLRFLDSCDFGDHPVFFEDVFLAVGSVSKWQKWIDELIESWQTKGFAFLVDMANGDSITCVETVSYIRERAPSATIMAGNVATKSGFEHLAEAGANFIRVGIGGGSICSTRLRTGFGVPTLTSILDCAEVKGPDVFLVADGGIEHPGDICKAIAAGADMVMAGKLFAATSMSPGRKVDSSGLGFGKYTPENDSDVKWVEYRGQASKEAQEVLGQGSVHSVEGVSGFIPYQGKTEVYIPGVLKNLANAMVYYGGCTDWASFKRHAKFVELTPQGWGESNTRVNQM